MSHVWLRGGVFRAADERRVERRKGRPYDQATSAVQTCNPPPRTRLAHPESYPHVEESAEKASMRSSRGGGHHSIKPSMGRLLPDTVQVRLVPHFWSQTLGRAFIFSSRGCICWFYWPQIDWIGLVPTSSALSRTNMRVPSYCVCSWKFGINNVQWWEWCLARRDSSI